MSKCKTKKLFNTITTLVFAFMLVISNYTQTVQATNISSPPSNINIEKISDDLYCITIIETTMNDFDKKVATVFSSKTKSGSKTVKYQNSKGTTLW